jgi:hypothetical protein
MIEADAADRCKRWQEAADMYTKALHVLLFNAMLPVTDEQVRHVQHKRFMCFMRVRSATSRR